MIKPCGHRVVIKPDDLEKVTAGGIIIAHANEKAQRVATETGTIISIGPTAWKDYSNGEPWASIGDHVVFAKFAGKIIEDNETKESFIIVNDEDIIAIG